MITFYEVELGDGDDLLITENALILCAYSEDTAAYNNFSYTANAMAIATGNEIGALKLTADEQRVARELFESDNEPALIEYIIQNGVPTCLGT